MRAATAPETILRAICRQLRKEGARVSVYAASDENAIATGSWPGVCDELGLVLVGADGHLQVQADGTVSEFSVGHAELASAVAAAIRRTATT